MQPSIQRTLRFAIATLLPLTIIGEIGLGAARAENNPFAICARELRELDITEGEALESCAEAWEPADLSWCVLRLNENTLVDATSALRSCFRSRRPLELADCAIDINLEFRERAASGFDAGETMALSALDHCRRSLLPDRFADCAVGLNRQTDFTQVDILRACIAAEAYPRTLFFSR